MKFIQIIFTTGLAVGLGSFVQAASPSKQAVLKSYHYRGSVGDIDVFSPADQPDARRYIRRNEKLVTDEFGPLTFKEIIRDRATFVTKSGDEVRILSPDKSDPNAHKSASSTGSNRTYDSTYESRSLDVVEVGDYDDEEMDMDFPIPSNREDMQSPADDYYESEGVRTVRSKPSSFRERWSGSVNELDNSPRSDSIGDTNERIKTRDRDYMLD